MNFLLETALRWVCCKLLEFAAPKKSHSRTIMPLPVLHKDDEEFTVETRDVVPAHLVTKIESFSLLCKYGIQEYESREFVAGDYKWRLTICLHGRGSNHISVYLTMAETNPLIGYWEVNAIVNIFLYNQILDNYICFRGKVRRFNQLKSKWGYSKLISEKALTDQSNGYLVDDCCTFGAEVLVIQSQQIFDRVSPLELMAPYKKSWKIPNNSKLRTLWRSEDFTVGGYQWYIWLHPKGDCEKDPTGKNISIFLCNVSSSSFAAHQKLKVSFYIRLKSKLGAPLYSVHYTSWFMSSASHCGRNEFMRASDMLDPCKGFTVDDCCIIETEIYVKAAVGLPVRV